MRNAMVDVTVIRPLNKGQGHSFLVSIEVAYEKSIGTKMNDHDLCLEVVSRSRQPLRYILR